MLDPMFAKLAKADPAIRLAGLSNLWGAKWGRDLDNKVTVRQLLSMHSLFPALDTSDWGPHAKDPYRATVYRSPSVLVSD